MDMSPCAASDNVHVLAFRCVVHGAEHSSKVRNAFGIRRRYGINRKRSRLRKRKVHCSGSRWQTTSDGFRLLIVISRSTARPASPQQHIKCARLDIGACPSRALTSEQNVLGGHRDALLLTR